MNVQKPISGTDLSDTDIDTGRAAFSEPTIRATPPRHPAREAEDAIEALAREALVAMILGYPAPD